jgi:CubicO group peptidase (beta-lactamase class C family)
MKFLIVFFLIYQVSFGSCPNINIDNFNSDQKLKINELVTKYKKRYKIPQIQIIVGNSENILFYKTFSSKSHTLFDLASITKVFSGLILLKILEANNIGIKDRISKYLGPFKDQNKNLITIEDLLRHQSGFKPGVGSGVLVDNNINQSFENILEISPTREYGLYVYSDINFLYIGMLIEKLSGLTLDKALEVYITNDLQLHSTLYRPHLHKDINCAPTRKDNKVCFVHDPTSFHLEGLTGHAGIFSSGLDLAKFAKVFLNQGKTCSSKIFSKNIYKMMTQKYPNNHRGLAFDITSPYSRRPRGEYFAKGLSFGHTGFTGTSMWIDPTLDTYMIVLTNTVYAKDEREAKRGYLDLLLELSNTIGQIRFSK